MNAQDKAEALLLANAVVMGTDDEGRLTADSIKAALDLRALIERQPDDADGEMWRFCVENGFPHQAREHFTIAPHWQMAVRPTQCDEFIALCDTPAEAVQAAMAAMKEKA